MSVTEALRENAAGTLRVTKGGVVSLLGDGAGDGGGVVLVGSRLKFAVIVTAVLPTMVQGAVPEHPPLVQPSKVEPEAGVADTVTELPEAYVPEQVVPQLIPAGELTTEPVPVPVSLTLTVMVDAVVIVASATAQTSLVYGDTLVAS